MTMFGSRMHLYVIARLREEDVQDVKSSVPLLFRQIGIALDERVCLRFFMHFEVAHLEAMDAKALEGRKNLRDAVGSRYLKRFVWCVLDDIAMLVSDEDLDQDRGTERRGE